MDNYIEFDSEVQGLYRDRGWPPNPYATIQDEHLLEIALNSADEQNSPIKRVKSTRDICTEGFEIRLPLEMFAAGRAPERCIYDMSALAKKDSIFLHLISCFDPDALNGIFKIAGDL